MRNIVLDCARKEWGVISHQGFLTGQDTALGCHLNLGAYLVAFALVRVSVL